MDHLAYIDSLNDEESLWKVYDEMGELALARVFWIYRLAFLRSRDRVERLRALTKCRYICRQYAASIPVTRAVHPFTAPHGFSGIFISTGARIGEGCTIFQQVTIGSNTLPGSKSRGFPTIGNGVFIGAGAKIIGGVTIGDNCRIGANCCVVCDVPPNSVVVMEKPRIITRTEPMDNTYISSKSVRKSE